MLHNEGAHLILMGPSTCGKTSLMLGLSELTTCESRFTIDRTWTTRPRRPTDTDKENIFIDQTSFDGMRDDFLFTFQTYPTYEYGISVPPSLEEDEIRLRVLMPQFARTFRQLVPEPTYFCAVMPYINDPERVLELRDPGLERADIDARLARFMIDQVEANDAADFSFKNRPGISEAVLALSEVTINFLQQHSTNTAKQSF
jgi:guanylate kinase